MTNLELLEQYFGSLTGANNQQITDFMSDDIIWHLPPAHPFGGPFIGIPAVQEMLGMGGDLFDFTTIAMQRHTLFGDGDNVCAHFQMNAQTPTGLDYQNQYLFRFRCHNEQIVEVWEFMDTYYQSQVGMFDKPPYSGQT